MSIPSFEPVKKFVRAGAGAGKTTRLTQEVLELAMDFHRQMGRWPKIVLTTFTRKATQELKERLVKSCLKDHPAALEFVQSTSYLTITTMHGLFQTFLSRYGYAMELPSQFKIVDSQQGDYWRKQVLRQILEENNNLGGLEGFSFHRLNESLRLYEAVHWSGDLQPVTKDGLEKLTRELCEQQARELELLVHHITENIDTEKWFSYRDRLDSIVQILKEEKTWEEKRLTLQESLVGLKKPTESKEKAIFSEEFKKHLSDSLKKIKALMADPDLNPIYWDRIESTLDHFSILGRDFITRLVEKKRKEASLETNDLEFFSLYLSKTKTHILEKFSQDFDAWFIDEFQDTSPLQLQVLEQMIGDRSCYIVGDPQQSIYLFRGSRSEVFSQQQKKMIEAGSQVDELRNNYRSQAYLLNFFNDFFTTISKDFSEMEAQKSESLSCAVELNHNVAEEPENELAVLSQRIQELIDAGENLKDICVLCRSRKELEKVQSFLVQQNFPVVSHSSGNFYKRREVIDALALLTFLLNPWDNKNLLTLMRSPWMGFDDEKLVQLVQDKKGNYWTHFRTYFNDNKSHSPGQIVLKAMAEKNTYGVGWVFRRCLIDLGLFDYSVYADKTGRMEANLWKLVNEIEKLSREPGGQLLRLARRGSLASSLEDIGDSGDASSPVEPNKISLMTVHGSKGLQFPFVFMPFLHKRIRETNFSHFCIDAERKLWGMRVPGGIEKEFVGNALEKLNVEQMRQRERKESLRVLYVGMTRASQKLFLSWTGRPETKSWGALFEHYIEVGNKLPQVKWTQWTESQAVSYHSQTETLVPREAFQSQVGRNELQVESYEPTNAVQPKTWQELEAMVEKRWQGTLLHRVFESLKYQEREASLQMAKGWLQERSADIEAAMDFVLENKEVPFADIIQNGEVEWGYQWQKEGQLLERRIDLWGITDKTLYIVDYKTGSSSHREKAFQQMEEYAEALRFFKDWQGPITMIAVFPFEQNLFKKVSANF